MVLHSGSDDDEDGDDNMPDIDVKPKELRIRVQDPKKFDKRSFRYHTNPSGCSAELVACPKGHFHPNRPKNEQCDVGMQKQSYRLKRKCYPTKTDARTWIKRNVCKRRPHESVCRLTR